MRRRSIGLFEPILILGISLFFAFTLCFMCKDEFQMKITGVETAAEIVDISLERLNTQKTEYTHRVTVRFEVDGRIYEGLLGHWSKGMEIGDKETVYYNPDNPADFSGDINNILYVGLFIVCFAGIAVGTRMLIGRLKNRRSAKALKETGIKITAAIKNVEINHSVMINGVYGHRLVCEVELPGSSELRCYYSETFGKEVKNVEGLLVDIYIDKDDPDNYIMDTKSITG